MQIGGYQYDANGNMTCRTENGSTFNQMYKVENRLSDVQLLTAGSSCPLVDTSAPTQNIAAEWSFAYDGDGNKTTQVYMTGGNSTTTLYFMAGAYEVTGSSVKKYYSFASMTIAANDGSGLKYLLTDQLGSAVAIANSDGSLASQQRYMPFGQVRTDVGPITQTDFGFTGQRANSYINLLDYHSRFMDPGISQFKLAGLPRSQDLMRRSTKEHT